MDHAQLILRLTVMALVVLSSSSLTISQSTSEESKNPLRNARTELTSLRGSGGARGIWSSWGTWSPCSRTCGGGIAIQTRNCLPLNSDNRTRGGRRRRRLPSGPIAEISSNQQLETQYERLNVNKHHCEGMDKRYHECNTLACPGPARDFRAEQCSAFDKRPFKGQYFVWLPYIVKDRPCALNCRPAGRRFYATLANLTIDGTECSKPGFRSVCVQGQCKAVGLNGVVSQWSGAGAGPGTGAYRCGSRLVSGLFTRTQLPLGYTHVATLPPGACRINITEMHHSNNFLALKTTNGSFIINGNFAISWSGEYDAAGTKFIYRRQGGSLVESISAAGPLLQSIDVMILYQHPNQGIKYEYTIQIPGDESQEQKPQHNPAPAPPLLVASNNNSPQSRSQHHIKNPRPEIDENSIIQQEPHPAKEVATEVTGNEIEPKRQENERFPYGIGVLATESEKPTHQIQRHRRRKFVWKAMGHSTCSKQCAGVQIRTLGCVREYNHIQVQEKRCGTKPPNPPRPCGGPCAPRWVLAPWSPCSATCGQATQSRQVQCKQDISFQTLNVKVADSLCPDNPPPAVQKCQLPECPPADRNEIQLKSNEVDPNRHPDISIDYGYNRIVTDQNNPRTNIRNRNYRGKDDTDKFTDSATQAIITRFSNESARDNSEHNELSNEISTNFDNPRYKNGNWKMSNAWMYSDWTQECSEECGKGLQTRTVKCADPSGCDERKRPQDSRACSSDRKCNTQSSKWFTGPWSQCSNPCAINGKMSREVICLSYYKGQNRVNIAGCPLNTKPDTERPCPPSMLRGDCAPEWFISDWSQCLGPCGSTHQTRLVICQSSSGGPENTCSSPKPANQRDCVPSQCHLGGITPAPRSDLRNGYENSIPNLPSNGECIDKIASCHVAVQARLCQYEYYASSCCAACRRAPNMS